MTPTHIVQRAGIWIIAVATDGDVGVLAQADRGEHLVQLGFDASAQG